MINAENQAHICFNSANDFINHISANLLETITIDNYRINANIAKIKQINTTPNYDVNQITYIVEYNDDFSYFRCYFVKGATLQSGYINMQLEIDYWATYFKLFKNSMLNVTRCNRNIGVGIYEDVAIANAINQFKALGGSNTEINGLPSYISESEFNVVFAVNFVASRNTIGTEVVSQTRMFAMKLSDLRTLVGTAGDDISSVQIACDVIGGIDSVTTNSWIGQTNKADVIGAWIVEDAYVIKSTWGAKFISSSHYGNNLQVEATAICGYSGTQYFNYETNLKYNAYFGAVNNGLKLLRFTKSNLEEGIYNIIGIKYIINANNVQVLAVQGDTEKDITQAFTLPLTTNAKNTTNVEKIANTLHWAMEGLRMGEGITKGVKDENYTGVISSVGSFATKFFDTLAQSADAKQGLIGNSDALITFGYSVQSANKIRYPYYLTLYESNIDEELKARMAGAKFDVVINDLFALKNYALLGKNNLNDERFDLTYLQANVISMNLPLNAYRTIQGIFTTGVYLKFIN